MFAFVFPGQGSQIVGMGQDLCHSFNQARDVFQEVDETLKLNLSKIIFEGPLETLTMTEYAQPALMTVSLAFIRVLEKDMGFTIANNISFVAGHSLGEYSALAAAQVLTIAQTAQLLKKRGQAMQQAVPLNQGGMMALLGTDIEQAEKIVVQAAQDEICEVANDNAPGQVVISGHLTALKRAEEIAKNEGIKRTIFLPVSAPFHCSLMKPAAQIMSIALQDETFQTPSVPVITNVHALPESRSDYLKSLLIDQITQRVRWRESMLKLDSLGVTHCIEIGAGKVLSNLAKRICPQLETFAINTPFDLDEFMKKFLIKKIA